MTEKYVAGVDLCTDRPTSLTFTDLFHWVIWQFPKPEKKGLCGAVRPPLAEHDWFPAIIEADKKRVYVHAHVGETFSSPELAAQFIHSQKRKK